MEKLFFILLSITVFAACSPKPYYPTSYTPEKFNTNKLDFETAYKFNIKPHALVDKDKSNPYMELASINGKRHHLSIPNINHRLSSHIRVIQTDWMPGYDEKESGFQSNKSVRKNKRKLARQLQNELRKHENAHGERLNSKDSERDPSKNWAATTGFILGILSYVPFVGVFLFLPGLVLSIMGLKSEKRTLAWFGIILNGLIVLFLILILIILINEGFGFSF